MKICCIGARFGVPRRYNRAVLGAGAAAPPALLDAEVQTADGEHVQLRTLFEPDPALVLFLRHYACVGCSRQVEELAPRVVELADLGVRVIFIGSGDAAQMGAFVERHALADKPIVMVTDPKLEAYAAADMQRSVWSALEPRALWFQLQAYGAGFRGHRGVQGDGSQQGGAVLLDGQARVVYARHARYTADNVDGSELVAAALAMQISTHEQRGGFVL